MAPNQLQTSKSAPFICTRHSSALVPYFSPPMLNWLKDLFYCVPSSSLRRANRCFSYLRPISQFGHQQTTQSVWNSLPLSLPLAAIQAHIFPQAGIGERTSGRRSLFGGAMSLNSFHLYLQGLIFRHENQTWTLFTDFSTHCVNIDNLQSDRPLRSEYIDNLP